MIKSPTSAARDSEHRHGSDSDTVNRAARVTADDNFSRGTAPDRCDTLGQESRAEPPSAPASIPARYATRSPDKDARFFDELSLGHSVADACRVAGYARPVVYRWRAQNQAFAASWQEARKVAVDVMEDEADRRAIHGFDEITHRGRSVQQRRRYSDTLLLARLRALRPEVYRDPPASRARATALAMPTTVVVRDHIEDRILRQLIEAGQLDVGALPDHLRALVVEHLGPAIAFQGQDKGETATAGEITGKLTLPG
jgi:hypothetical protein